MAKIKTYSVTKDVADSRGRIYKIFVYGEVTEENTLDGVEVRRVRYQRGSGNVVSGGSETAVLPLGDNCSPTKSFNYGYAICAPGDEFDEKKGIEIAKKRFSKSPIKTQDCRFLKKGMVEAILQQSIEYVATHELAKVIEKAETMGRVFQTFRNGEIVKDDVAIYPVCFEENGIVYSKWRKFKNSLSQIIIFNVEIPIESLKNLQKVSDDERNMVQNLLKETYHNQWDENNAKFVKA